MTSTETINQASLGFDTLIDDEALANKYRPRRLSDVVDQDHVTSILMAQNRSGNRHHRVKLFSGPSGCGKTTIARALAAFELCDNPNLEIGDACGVCDACISVIDGRRAHPDVHEHDASSNTSRKEDVERLVSRFNISPMQGDVQVFILDEAHGLSRQAEDALLTHIENLAAHNRVYLLTTEPESVPSTIRGRAQQFELKLPSPAKVVEHLLSIAANEGWSLSREVAELIVELTPDSEGVRQAVTNLSKLAVLLTEGRSLDAASAASLLGAADAVAVAGIVEAVTLRNPELILERLEEARSSSSARDVYRALVRELRHRWKEAVRAGKDPSVFSRLANQVLDALRSEDYVDFLVELALCEAGRPLGAVSAAPAGSASSVDPEPVAQPVSEPVSQPASEVAAQPTPVDEASSAPSSEGAGGSSLAADDGLKDKLVAALEELNPRPQVALALVSQYAKVVDNGDKLMLVLPSQALADRLSDGRHREVLRLAASGLGLAGFEITFAG